MQISILELFQRNKWQWNSCQNFSIFLVVGIQFARCQPARSGLESETVREVKTFQTLMLMITESNLNDHRLKSQRNTFQCQVKEAKRKIHS